MAMSRVLGSKLRVIVWLILENKRIKFNIEISISGKE
jgi:hypothetical protein